MHAEVWAPETFRAPPKWRERAKTFTFDELPDVTVVCPHPHDVVVSKLERMDPKDREHVHFVLAQLPMTLERLDALVGEYVEPRADDRRQRFEHHLTWLRAQLSG
ncbi:MAG: hypothetical protein JNG84_10670 [Archangium sp.]|nr:hypothetical protein [Archangium sp.]